MDWEPGKSRAELPSFLGELPDGPGHVLSFDRDPSAPSFSLTETSALPQYELVRVLGQGAMGIVYLARNTQLQREVALKMLLSGRLNSEGLLRFKAEAETIARCRHPNIVQIYEAGDCQGFPFLALEYVPGGTLQELIRKGPLPAHEAAKLMETVARAVQHAHAHGIVHRDLKPANILLDAHGVPKLGDFGLAKQVDSGIDPLTRSGVVVGTPHYMAPEQALGQSKQISPAADVYSLGVILYEMLTGHVPLDGEGTLGTLMAVTALEPRSFESWGVQVPRDLAAICMKCLEKPPVNRYASAEAFADDLNRFREGLPVVARPVSALQRIARWCRRKPVRAMGLALVAALFVIGLPAMTVLAIQMSALYEAANENKLQAEAALLLVKQRSDEVLREKQKAVQSAVVAQTQVARLRAETGARLLDDGDLYASMVWSADALALYSALETSPDADDEVRRAAARAVNMLKLRLTTSLAQAPSLKWEVQLPELPQDLWFQEDGQGILLWNGQSLDVVNVLTGARGPHPWQPTSNLATITRDKRFAVTLESELIQLWKLADGELFAELERPESVAQAPFHLAHVGPGDRFLLAGQWPFPSHSKLWVWDLETGRPVSDVPFEPSNWEIQHYEFLANGRQLVIAPDGTNVVFQWNLPAAEPVEILRTGISYGSFRRISPGVQWLIQSDNIPDVLDRLELRMWDVQGRKSQPQPLRPQRPEMALYFEFTPSGKYVASAEQDNAILVCESETGRPVSELLRTPSPVDEHQFQFNSQETLLFALSREGAVHVWDFRRSQRVAPPLRHASPIKWARWDPSGQRIVTVAQDRTLRLWNLEGRFWGHPIPNEPPATKVAFSADGRLAVGSSDGYVRIRRPGQSQPMYKLPEGEPFPGPIADLCWGDHTDLLAATGDYALKLFAVPRKPKPGAVVKTTTPGNPGMEIRETPMNPRGTQLFYTHADRLNFYDAKTERDVIPGYQPVPHMPVLNPIFSPRGDWVAFTVACGTPLSGADYPVRMLNAKTGQEKNFGKLPFHSIDDLAFCPEGKFLAMAAGYGLRVWDVDTQALLVDQLPGIEGVGYVGFGRTPGHPLLTVSAENRVQVWPLPRKEPLGPAIPLEGSAALIELLDNGETLLTVQFKGEVRLWDVRSGEALTPRQDLGSWILSAQLSPDGKLLALAGRNGPPRLWEFPAADARTPAEWRALAAHLAARQLSDTGEYLPYAGSQPGAGFSGVASSAPPGTPP